ncbi:MULTISPECIES: ABC transporter permease [Aneurinibacillus]|jgi:dipeptide transport system permease protein|uniref:Dipeptide transport system permease protein DppC n=1 Tax=Aneurinibacillus danicus TaxID=267746 RepID=A0A511V3H6_9BACL|nr:MULTISPECIES: ABC transporter permease [Aneurinibacillus]GEN33466.1 dipeptide transport system permease protein DppC [Aneurinibacillus danicus]
MQPETRLTADMFRPVTDNFKDAEKIERPSISYRADVWRRLKLNKLAMAGLFIIIVLVIMAIIGPMISGYTYYKQDFTARNLRPSAEHWFGTDSSGRDIFTRIWYGARISLFIGVMAAFIDFVIGVIYGGISGLKGGRVDNIMMRIAEVLYSVPYLLMVILLMVIIGPGLWTIIMAMTLTGWIPMARLVRGQVLQLKEQEYVQASIALGADAKWILMKHILPNTMGLILVNVTLTVPTAIFAEATLSFLGLGIPAPRASWGTMANDALVSLLIGNAYQLFIPGFFISLTMFAFNVLGDGMRDALDPRMRK